MPMENVTEIVLNEEAKEMEEILKSNTKAKEAYEQFEAECKLRRELANARKQQNITQTELNNSAKAKAIKINSSIIKTP